MADDLGTLTNEQLWRLFPIILCPHDPAWAERYRQERALIEEALGPGQIARIDHIGSTAVPGLLAKPTIDILLEIDPESDPDRLPAALAEVGYRLCPQPRKPPPHMMFLKGYTPQGFCGQVYHLHVRYPGDWDEPYFRDYLSAHPEVAAEYAALKADLATRYEHDRDGYTDAKEAFVRRITALARAAFPGRHAYDPVRARSD